MATESPLIRDGSQLVAGADLSAKQFYAVKLSTSANKTASLASTGGEAIYGILQNKPTTGQACDVGIFGVTKAVAGATITTGDLLMTDTSGRVITRTSTNSVIGEALENATATGQVISIKVPKTT